MISKETKNCILYDYKISGDIKSILVKYKISKSTLYNWLKLEKILKSSKEITEGDYNQLNKNYLREKLKLEIFEKLHCFKDSSTIEKQKAISKFYNIYPMKLMCNLLDISTGTVYNYYFRRKNNTQYKKRDEELKKEIYKIYIKSGKRFGAKKIEAKLRINGINTTLHKVQTLMKLLNIQSIQKIRKKNEAPNNNSKYYVNKLKRIFNQTAPNKFWVGDVTELRVGKNKFYLCVILDLFSRKVIAYRLSSQNNTYLTINTFKDAYENRGRPKSLSFHSDQGSNYTAYEFRELLKLFKVNQSFSKAGNPYDNACMESFFSNLKREEYNIKEYTSFDELQESMFSYIDYYNDYRPHQTLNNNAPNYIEKDFFVKNGNKKTTNLS